MTEQELKIEQKATQVLNLIKGLTLKEYKEVIRFIDNEVQLKFKL